MEGKAQPSPPRVKKENEEEIKEFAETAMNELLGWYGYERLELRRWAASRARDASSPEQNTEHKNKDECSWCNKSISGEGGALQQAGAAFCSELCFSQSRRATFKRAKTCDWCRHVRHTVAYVDFQDGATQLQFCSDKCLNQYKMHIFCRETQAHLELNPHLASSSSSTSLITPDLWLKNCRSRSPSPPSERTPSPHDNKQTNDKTEPTKTQKSPLPLITIAPTAKLMKQKRASEETTQKSPEGKKDTKTKMNLRKRRSSKCSATVTSQSVRRTATPKAQDLRLRSPSEGSSPAAAPSPPPPPAPPFPGPMFSMPPPMFSNHAPLPDLRHPGMFPPRLGFMPRPALQIPQERPRLPPPTFPSPFNQGPPVTVLVPYPVVLPVPIPIPIPMPLSAFVRAHRVNVKQEARSDETDVPLDFTMNSHRKEDTFETDTNSVQSEVADSNTESVAEQSDVTERVEEDKLETEGNESGNPEQTLPKFKITRLGNKMSKIVVKARDSESTRPLRKRRRLVDATEDDALIHKTRKIVQV